MSASPPLTLHWFLPTNGDGRQLVGGGHALGTDGSAGSHSDVADRIAEYHALGIDEFVLSGYPHLEEAWWFGEGVAPILRRRGLWAPDPVPAAPVTAAPAAAAR
jgi:alkanesulfonate monooxygenase